MATRTIQPGEIGADYVGTSNKTRELFTKHGVTHVTRYVKPGHSAYEIVAPERDRLFSWGIAITIVFETHERAIYGGAQQGQIDGYLARLDCEQLGYPHVCPIFAAVDTDVVKSNSALCNDYLRAFYSASAPYTDGGYFDTEGFKLVADLHPIWCKPNAGGWDADPALRPLCHIWQGRQDLTIGWDYPNRVQHPFTAWTGLGADKPATVHPPTDTTQPAPAPKPLPSLEGEMKNGIIRVVEDGTTFVGVLNDRGAALEVRWTGPGTTDVYRWLDAHRAQGAVDVEVAKAGLVNCCLNGPVPPGWTAADFAPPSRP